MTLYLTNILDKISAIVDTYESGSFRDLHIMHRQLTCNMYYLSKEQVEANVRWNKAYYEFDSKVNAAKERHADKEVPELYMCRKIMETAKGVSIAMGYEIKMN